MKIRISICLAFAFMAFTSVAQNNNATDSLRKIATNTTLHDTLRLSARVEIGEVETILRLGYWDSIAVDCQKALDMKPSAPVEKALIKWMAHAYNNLGYITKNEGNSTAALSYYFKSQKLQEEIGNKEGIATTCNNIGLVYYHLGDIPAALDYYERSLKIREQLGDKKALANTLNNIGLTYHSQWDTLKALEYYEKSLVIREEIGDKKGVAQSLNNIGSIYEDYGDSAKTLSYYKKSYTICEEINDGKGMSLALSNIAHLYSLEGDYEKALDFSFRALVIREEMNSKPGIANSLRSIGGIYLELGKTDSALHYALRSMAIAQEIGYPEQIMNAAELLSKIYTKQKQGMPALEMYKLYIMMRDSLNNEATQKASAKQQARYAYEKQKAIDDAGHEAERALQEEAKAKQRVITYAVGAGLVLVVVFLIFVFNRLQLTRKQRNIIAGQKEIVETAHHALAEKSKEILDSINYARRIQNAILPSAKTMREHLPDSFVMYKPKDIVAGDFYWLEIRNEMIHFAAADCTGHGVPGAMVSVICNNGLNRSVREHGISDPGKILDKTREIVIQEFEKSEDEVKDGMDISICTLKGNQLQWAGANNPLWIIRNNELLEIKADKQPIGKYAADKPFTTHSLLLQPGDLLYLFSDGYADQFGGEKGKKFKTSRLKELLLSIHKEPMHTQLEHLKSAFENWKGNIEQVDDVLIIGFRFA